MIAAEPEPPSIGILDLIVFAAIELQVDRRICVHMADATGFGGKTALWRRPVLALTGVGDAAVDIYTDVRRYSLASPAPQRMIGRNAYIATEEATPAIAQHDAFISAGLVTPADFVGLAKPRAFRIRLGSSIEINLCRRHNAFASCVGSTSYEDDTILAGHLTPRANQFRDADSGAHDRQ